MLKMVQPPCFGAKSSTNMAAPYWPPVDLRKAFQRISEVWTHTDPKLGEMFFFLPISYNITISWLYPLNSSQFIFSLRDMRLHFVVGRLLNLLFYVIWRSHTPQHHNRAHFRVAFEASLSKWGLERCTTILEMTLFACKEISFVYSLRLALRKRLKTKRFLSGLLSRARTQTTRFGF